MKAVPSSECPASGIARHSRCSYLMATLDLTRTLETVLTLSKRRLGYCRHTGVRAMGVDAGVP